MGGFQFYTTDRVTFSDFNYYTYFESKHSPLSTDAFSYGAHSSQLPSTPNICFLLHLCYKTVIVAPPKASIYDLRWAMFLKDPSGAMSSDFANVNYCYPSRLFTYNIVFGLDATI